MRKRHLQGRRHGWIAYAVALPLAVVMLVPFLYMVATALTSEPDSLRHLVPEHFGAALAALPFGRFLFTSVIFSLAVVAGQVVTSATAAYAFARLRFPGRDRVFLIYLCVLMAPAIVLVIPRFLLIDALGWVDSYQGLISTELVSVTGIFLLRQFFRTIPRDLEDAARPRHTRRARVRRSVAELCVAARGHPLERDAAARGRHREPAGHVRPELVRPDGDRGGGGDTADGLLFGGAEVFHSRH